MITTVVSSATTECEWNDCRIRAEIIGGLARAPGVRAERSSSTKLDEGGREARIETVKTTKKDILLCYANVSTLYAVNVSL